MCTVTYLPTGEHTFILTSNRDERNTRKPASFPASRQTLNGDQLIFPKDREAGGTWIACSASLTVCLLNGAFEAHLPKPPYRLSRGLVVLAAFNYPHINHFIKDYGLEGIEPFTMILLSHSNHELSLTELRWDGKKKYLTHKDSEQPYIWSSVTLYTPPLIQKREEWFSQWLAREQAFTVEEIRKFHYFGGEGDPAYNIKMNRAGLVSTVSITSVVCLPAQLTMHYEDMHSDHILTHSLSRNGTYSSHLL